MVVQVIARLQIVVHQFVQVVSLSAKLSLVHQDVIRILIVLSMDKYVPNVIVVEGVLLVNHHHSVLPVIMLIITVVVLMGLLI